MKSLDKINVKKCARRAQGYLCAYYRPVIDKEEKHDEARNQC